MNKKANKKQYEKIKKSKIDEILKNEFGIFHPGSVVINEILERNYKNEDDIDLNNILEILENKTELKNYLDEYYYIETEEEANQYYEMIDEVKEYFQKIL